MSLLEKIIALLDSQPLDVAAIIEALSKAPLRGEHEVARALVAKRLSGLVEGLIESPHQRERIKGLKLAGQLWPRHRVAALVRRATLDSSQRVRGVAYRVARRSLLTDVAPPYFRLAYRDVGYRHAKSAAEHGMLGWFFGKRWRFADKAPQRLPITPGKAFGGPGGFARTLPELFEQLGIDGEAGLRRLLRPGAGPGAAYVSFTIPKRSGAEREICAPRPALRAVQRRILHGVLAGASLHEACHGFVKGRSTLSNASPHVGAVVVIKTDIAGFFPTIHRGRVRGLFLMLGAPPEVAGVLASLCTYRRLEGGKVVAQGVLPQGAPTSPMVANLVCRRLDARLSGLAASLGATYTRYADDLTFSFEAEPPCELGRVFWWVNAILQQEGFAENTDKRRVLRRAHRQQVTGVVVNERAALPRELRKRLRAIVHNVARDGVEAQSRGQAGFALWLRGMVAYASMIEPAFGSALAAKLAATTAQKS